MFLVKTHWSHYLARDANTYTPSAREEKKKEKNSPRLDANDN